jgi:hypothetical protein
MMEEEMPFGECYAHLPGTMNFKDMHGDTKAKLGLLEKVLNALQRAIDILEPKATSFSR